MITTLLINNVNIYIHLLGKEKNQAKQYAYIFERKIIMQLKGHAFPMYIQFT